MAKADTFFKPPADSGGCLLASGNISNIVEFLRSVLKTESLKYTENARV